MHCRCYKILIFIIPPLHWRGRGYTVLPLSVFQSVSPSVCSKIFFVAFFSATIYWWQKSDIWSQASYRYPYRGKRFWTRHIPTSCLRGYHKWALAHSSSCLSCPYSLYFSSGNQIIAPNTLSLPHFCIVFICWWTCSRPEWFTFSFIRTPQRPGFWL